MINDIKKRNWFITHSVLNIVDNYLLINTGKKDVKCQKVKHLDYGGGSQKK